MKINFIHTNEADNRILFTLSNESTGTKKIISLVTYLINSSYQDDLTIFIDDFANYLHPEII